MSRRIEITGVLVDPEALSCTIRTGENSSLEHAISELRTQLVTKYNGLVGPGSLEPVEQLDVIGLTTNPTTLDNALQPISHVSIPVPKKQGFTLLFKAPDGHTLHAHFEQNRAQAADHLAVALAQEEELMKLRPPKTRKRKKGDPVAHISQTDHVIFLEKTVEDLKREVEELTEALRSKQLEVQELYAIATPMPAYFARHELVLVALHRRVVLDQARAILVKRYSFTTTDFEFGGRGRPSLTQMVKQLRLKFTSQDKLLLPIAAVKMIFANGEGTLRKEGNIAAHTASPEDMDLASLSVGLEGNSARSFKSVYTFAMSELAQESKSGSQ